MNRYDAETALIVVDVQNDFADPKGSLYVRGAERVIGFINQEIARAKTGGAAVVYTQDWHPPSTSHFEKDGGIWPVHCVVDTWGAAFYPKLRVEGAVVKKGAGGEDGYSGFTVADSLKGSRHGTGLEELLRQRGVEKVVVVGLATDYCVKATALDAMAIGLETSVLSAGVRAVDRTAGDGERALDVMRASGVAVLGR